MIKQETVLVTAALILGILFAAVAIARAGEQTRFYDAQGRSAGTATTSGNQTTFRDAQGRTTGTATKDSGGTTTFRDQGGRVTGRAGK